ncbi:MAG: 4Fe-4S dicluster domain-containing protein [Desulfobacterales bacterium]|jgi:heterodisulfide reductase subunit C|nr:4Fe-4S dicluster domain-containing protein [Desulfobacterales bacterium]
MTLETALNREKVGSSFLEEAEKRSGENLSLCYQCLKCTAGCPTAPNMDIRPNSLIRMIQMGRKQEVLESSAIWFCVYCQTCGTRCPNEIHIGVLMDALREMAMEEGVHAKEKNIHLFHEAFIQSVRRGGRAHEVTMLMEYILRSRDLMKDSLIPGVKLFLKGKFPLLPSFVKGKGEIKRIFEKCKKEK